MIRDGSGTRLDHALEWEEDNTNASRFSTSGADEAVRKMEEQQAKEKKGELPQDDERRDV